MNTDRPTPLRAIRLRCLDCSGNSAAEVRDCDRTHCALFAYRLGKRPKRPATMTPVKSMRAYCLWCCDGSAKEVRLCPKRGCPLHVYRLGHNPARKGIRHAGSFGSAPQLADCGQERPARPEAYRSDGTPQTTGIDQHRAT